jgi:hypothetical protein
LTDSELDGVSGGTSNVIKSMGHALAVMAGKQ